MRRWRLVACRRLRPQYAEINYAEIKLPTPHSMPACLLACYIVCTDPFVYRRRVRVEQQLVTQQRIESAVQQQCMFCWLVYSVCLAAYV